MKQIVLILSLLVLTLVAFTSCRETVTKEVRIEKETSDGVLERAAKKVDDKVNKEIDKTIDKIGDDN